MKLKFLVLPFLAAATVGFLVWWKKDNTNDNTKKVLPKDVPLAELPSKPSPGIGLNKLSRQTPETADAISITSISQLNALGISSPDYFESATEEQIEIIANNLRNNTDSEFLARQVLGLPKRMLVYLKDVLWQHYEKTKGSSWAAASELMSLPGGEFKQVIMKDLLQILYRLNDSEETYSTEVEYIVSALVRQNDENLMNQLAAAFKSGDKKTRKLLLPGYIHSANPEDFFFLMDLALQENSPTYDTVIREIVGNSIRRRKHLEQNEILPQKMRQHRDDEIKYLLEAEVKMLGMIEKLEKP